MTPSIKKIYGGPRSEAKSGMNNALHFLSDRLHWPPIPGGSWRKIPISNNVGGVKHFSSTRRHALEEERHFALVEAFAFALPTKARSQSVSGQELSPTHPSLRSQLRS